MSINVTRITNRATKTRTLLDGARFTLVTHRAALTKARQDAANAEIALANHHAIVANAKELGDTTLVDSETEAAVVASKTLSDKNNEVLDLVTKEVPLSAAVARFEEVLAKQEAAVARKEAVYPALLKRHQRRMANNKAA